MNVKLRENYIDNALFTIIKVVYLYIKRKGKSSRRTWHLVPGGIA